MRKVKHFPNHMAKCKLVTAQMQRRSPFDEGYMCSNNRLSLLKYLSVVVTNLQIGNQVP